VHQLDNIALAFDMLMEQAQVKTNFLKREQLVDHDLKMMLGMVWAIILDFQIKGISVEELSAKEGLLLWCKRKTAGYKDVKIENFTTTWQDGLAFCALIHRHRPDLLDYDALSKSDPKHNLKLAFDIAESLGIPRLLDIEDLTDVPRPDEKAVMTYVSEYFKYFSSQNQVELAGKRISSLVDMSKLNDQMKTDYINKAKHFLEWVAKQEKEFQDHTYGNTLKSIEEKWEDQRKYKKTTKPEKSNEKLSVEGALNTLQAKLRLNNRKPYEPPAEYTTENINKRWNQLGDEEREREKWIRTELERQHRLEQIASRFWRKAAALLNWGKTNESSVSSTDYGDSYAATSAKLKTHQGFEENFNYNEKRLEGTKALGNELIQENYGEHEKVKHKVQELDNMWVSLKGFMENRRQGLEKELEHQKHLDELRLEFATKSRKFVTWIEDQEDGEIAEPIKANSLENVGKLQTSFTSFKQELGSQQSEYQALLDLSSKMQNEGITNNIYAVYTIDDVTNRWNNLHNEVGNRETSLSQEHERLTENDNLCKNFASHADKFSQQLDSQKHDAEKPQQGSLQDQLASTQNLRSQFQNKNKEGLSQLAEINTKMDQRNITNNDYTGHTYESLSLNADSIVEFVNKQISLIEKQIIDESGKGISQEQLNEFKDTFKAFDKDKSNTLEKHEFKACLSALGYDATDDAVNKLVGELGKQVPGKIVFDEFVDYMISKTQNVDSPNTIKDSFKEVASGKDYITQDDLKKVPGLSKETIEYLLSNMKNLGDGKYDYSNFVDSQY